MVGRVEVRCATEYEHPITDTSRSFDKRKNVEFQLARKFGTSNIIRTQYIRRRNVKNFGLGWIILGGCLNGCNCWWGREASDKYKNCGWNIFSKLNFICKDCGLKENTHRVCFIYCININCNINHFTFL